MSGYRFVSFLTDYGLDDGFVAICHGVLLGIVPQARIIDISHTIPPQDIQKGAHLLARVTPYLPIGVHVAVVDPGVGGTRKAIAVETARGIFVGPDNGLLSWAIDDAGGRATSYELTNSRLFRSPVSRTFHGRDIFMPVAGHLAAGLPLSEVGPGLDPGSLVRLPNPVDRVTDTGLATEVILVDHFGNVHLASSSAQLDNLSMTLGDYVRCVTPVGEWVAKYVGTFDDAQEGEVVFYVDAVGQLAIAVSSGNAARLLGVTPGMVVTLGMYS
ncbi:MAG: SAM-dependent chlorinase/fluorinase [Actinomycetota bacterium]|nr:SAM-dependent chlorinase/fluorinase [Actinomycetota bacterium]